MEFKDSEVGSTKAEFFEGQQSPHHGGIKVPNASVWTLLMISMPRMAINAAWAAQWAAVGPWLSTIMPNWAVQITQFVGPTVGILIAPIVGVLSDRCTHPWGRRRIWIVIPAILSIICWNLMAFTRKIGDSLGDYGDGTANTPTDRKYTILFMVFFYIWMDVTVNIVQTPCQLLVADLAGDRQTLGQALSQGWSTLGALIIAIYIQIFGPAYETIHAFMLMLSTLMAVSVTAMCITARETPLLTEDNSSKCSQVARAFGAIYRCILEMPGTLWGLWFITFTVMYGFTAYNGGKGQFFGYEVYHGDSAGADTCGDTCTIAQENFNDGVQMATGLSDILYNCWGYIYSWLIPLFVKRIGLKWTLAYSLIPQVLLIVVAFVRVVVIDVIIVVLVSMAQTALFSFMIPVCLYVAGEEKDVGITIGALNSANCLGQLLNFALSSAMVRTKYGYALPIFVGGIVTVVGFLFTVFCFKVRIFDM